MKPFPFYEFFFALASYVSILSFVYFARRKPALFPGNTRIFRTRMGVFIGGSAVAVFAGGLGLGALQGLTNGVVFYGGLLGFLIFAFLYARVFASPFMEILNRVAPGLALAHAVGRIGCFMDGCCYGTHCDLPWAVHNATANDVVHPVQLYEAGCLVILGFFIWRNEINRLRGITRRSTAGVYLIAYSILRFLLEFIRGDGTRGYLGLLSTSQWIAVFLFALGLRFTLRPFRAGKCVGRAEG